MKLCDKGYCAFCFTTTHKKYCSFIVDFKPISKINLCPNLKVCENCKHGDGAKCKLSDKEWSWANYASRVCFENKHFKSSETWIEWIAEK